MNSMTVFIFRTLLVLGGIVLIYIIGKPVLERIQYRISGASIEGKVIGFRGSRNSTTIFDDNTARKGNKSRARRPVYKYPKTAGSLDSLTGFSSSTILMPWFNFDKGESVNVVFNPEQPEKSHIFSLGIMLTDTVLIFLCLYMIKLGLTRR